MLHLESKEAGLSITISCEVQWIRGSQKDEWIVGCRFEHNLEAHLLEDYVEQGLLERRETDRFEISLRSARSAVFGGNLIGNTPQQFMIEPHVDEEMTRTFFLFVEFLLDSVLFRDTDLPGNQ